MKPSTDPYRQPALLPTKIYSVTFERRTHVSLDVEAASEEEAKLLAQKHIDSFYRGGVCAETTILDRVDVLYESEEVPKYKENNAKSKAKMDAIRAKLSK